MVKRITNRLNKAISSVEGVFVNPNKELNYPVIFIVGAPRSGTTLLYQLITNMFDVAYLSNLHAKFFGAPSYVERLVPLNLFRSKSHNYQSDYGETNALFSPNECGAFWYRFFPKNVHQIKESEVDDIKLRKAIVAFVNAAHKPVVYKNVYNILRLRTLAKVIPEAYFVVMKRDLAANIRSILRARKKAEGSYEEWFSVRTHNLDQIASLSPVEQVGLQVEDIYKRIDEARLRTGKERFFDFEYERLCKNPHEVMDQFRGWLEQVGCLPKLKFEIPDHFSIQNRELEPEIEKEISEFLEQNGNKDAHKI